MNMLSFVTIIGVCLVPFVRLVGDHIERIDCSLSKTANTVANVFIVIMSIMMVAALSYEIGLTVLTMIK
jgi:hypothetical protein